MPQSLWSSFVAGVRAFREAYFSATPLDQSDFSDVDGRRMRYDLYWSLYASTVYRDVHRWSRGFRTTYGLYKSIRPIHNPAYRLAEFYATHLLGGGLDPAAGDGQAAPSALPIVTGNERLRPALARLWRDSRWQTNKDIWTRTGTILGDVGLEIVDDPVRKRVTKRVVHPGSLSWVETDDAGNVKAYAREEQRPHPATPERSVTYLEEVTRAGDAVVYTTYLNGDRYDWTGMGETWRIPYGFVPLVMAQHINVGLEWGWSEYHAALAKIREVDDLASSLSDQIRKTVNPIWILAGMKAQASSETPPGRTATAANPEPWRDEVNVRYAADPQASAKAMVAPLDIAGVSARILQIVDELERDYPELRFDRLRAAGDASGTALRIARQPAESKVVMRRAPYDEAHVRADQMAVAIGGWRGYAGYEGFSLASYAAGALDHRIGDRPVFSVDAMQRLEEDEKFWTVAKLAVDAGEPLAVFLEDQGWTEAQIARLTERMSQSDQVNLERSRLALARDRDGIEARIAAALEGQQA